MMYLVITFDEEQSEEIMEEIDLVLSGRNSSEIDHESSLVLFSKLEEALKYINDYSSPESAIILEVGKILHYTFPDTAQKLWLERKKQ